MTSGGARAAASVETPTDVTVLRDDGLVQVTIKPGARQTLEDARENVEAVASVASGTQRPLLVDMRQAGGIERPARTYYSGPDGARVITALAILVSSPMSRVLGNFFIGLNRMLVPCKLFSDEEDAVAWLRGFLP